MLDYRYYPLRLQNLIAITCSSLPVTSNASLQVTRYAFVKLNLSNVTESPIDSRLKDLDVLCFPVLYPNGEFGENHPRNKEITLTFSEFVKQRLHNKDSRFRKDASNVFIY